MIKRMLALAALGALLSGCFMAPLALLGPVTSGFSTASLIQSGATTTLNFMVKKSTGKSVSEYILDGLDKEILQQTYFPTNKIDSLVNLKSNPALPHKN